MISIKKDRIANESQSASWKCLDRNQLGKPTEKLNVLRPSSIPHRSRGLKPFKPTLDQSQCLKNKQPSHNRSTLTPAKFVPNMSPHLPLPSPLLDLHTWNSSLTDKCFCLCFWDRTNDCLLDPHLDWIQRVVHWFVKRSSWWFGLNWWHEAFD